jgi:alkanesulfonate monooxygenase SsuD/methylene tetrahydromethanopterin reductase-like flavin-dependent oxidoreductase (luciferase family)
MRTGVILPTFRETPAQAIMAAEGAVEAGVDGLFCYDHLWPLGQPERPALAPFPILGALAGRLRVGRQPDEGPYLGSMVARVGLVPNSVLVAEFTALEQLAPGRVIAGLGTGDRLSAAENRAFGVPYPPVSERRAAMVEVAEALLGRGIAVWLAGGASGRSDEARATGAALTVWDVGPASIATYRAEPDPLEVTWAGPPPADLASSLVALARAGSSWAVAAWPVDVAELVRAGLAASADSSQAATS